MYNRRAKSYVAIAFTVELDRYDDGDWMATILAVDGSPLREHDFGWCNCISDVDLQGRLSDDTVLQVARQICKRRSFIGSFDFTCIIDSWEKNISVQLYFSIHSATVFQVVGSGDQERASRYYPEARHASRMKYRPLIY